MPHINIHIVAVFVISFIILLFSRSFKEITITKPSFYPPDITFSIVWSLLFVLYALYLSSIVDDKQLYITSIVTFIITLLWTPIYTNTKNFNLAFNYILFTLFLNISLFLLVLSKKGFKHSLMLIPLISWLTFATILFYKVRELN